MVWISRATHVDLGKVVHVLHKDGDLEHMALVRARGLEHGHEVLEHLLGLRLNAALDDLHRLGVQRNAAREVGRAVVHDALRVGADGAGGVGGGNSTVGGRAHTSNRCVVNTHCSEGHRAQRRAHTRYVHGERTIPPHPPRPCLLTHSAERRAAPWRRSGDGRLERHAARSSRDGLHARSGAHVSAELDEY